MGVDNNEDVAHLPAIPQQPLTMGQVHQMRAQSLQRTVNEQLQIVEMMEQQLAIQQLQHQAEVVKLSKLIAKHAERVVKLEEENRVLNAQIAGMEAEKRNTTVVEDTHSNGRVGDGVYKG